MKAIERLLSLQQENDEAGQRMVLAAPRFNALANRHIKGTAPRAITAFNLFQTPEPEAVKMAELIRPWAIRGRILEPSAGLGRLVFPLCDVETEWVIVEDARECYNALLQAVNVARKKMINCDFLQLTADDLGGRFDAIVMNPPFKRGRDIKHIEHAATLLKPGGRLVSLCYDGPRQHARLKPLSSQWEVLPEGSFRDEGTGTSVVRLVIDNKGGPG
jgi:SAM-dependent methyltransferase